MPKPVYTRPVQGAAPNQFVQNAQDQAEINRALDTLWTAIIVTDTDEQIQSVLDAADSSQANAVSAAASSASAGASSGRLDVESFAELTGPKFTMGTPGAGQQQVAVGDVILWRGKGLVYEVVSNREDFSNENGVKIMRVSLGAIAADTDPGQVVWRPRERGSFTAEAGASRSAVTYAQIIGLWETLRADYPGWITRNVVGQDQSGTHDIYTYVMTPENGFDRTVIVEAGIHGPEVMNMLCAYLFFREMGDTWGHGSDTQNGGLGAARNRVRWVVVPVANPWGLNESPKNRKNSNGVDLNRNFDFRWAKYPNTGIEAADYKGVAPFSEAETLILKSVAEAYPDAVAAVGLHDYVGPSGPTDTAIFFPDMVLPKNTREILSRLGMFQRAQGLTINATQNSGPQAFNYYASIGMNSSNPEWAFNAVSSAYSADDVTLALAFYGNTILAHAFAAPAQFGSALGPKVYRLRNKFSNFVIDAGTNLTVFTDLGPDFTISTSGMLPGIMKLDQTIFAISAIGEGGEDLIVNAKARFGMDGAQRGSMTASGGSSSLIQRHTLRPGENSTINTTAAGIYYPSENGFVRYRPQISVRQKNSVAISGALNIQTFEALIWLFPSDGAPAMDAWRLPSAGAGAWEFDSVFD